MRDNLSMPETDDPEALDPVAVAIGGRFKRAMKAVHLTQETLADEAGIGQPAVSSFVNGKKGLETSRLLRVLLVGARHGISIDGVVTGSGPLSLVDVSTDDARLAGALHRLAEQLVSRESAPQDRRSTHKGPRPAGKRRKA